MPEEVGEVLNQHFAEVFTKEKDVENSEIGGGEMIPIF